MSTPPAVEGSGGVSVGAGPSTGPRRLTPAVSGLPSNTGHFGPSALQYQVPGFAPSGDKRRFSGVDPLGVQHLPVYILNQHAHENQPTPSAYPLYPWSGSPPAIPTAQNHGAVPADMVPGPSSLTYRKSVVSESPYSEESFQLSPSSGLQGDLDSDATFSPRYASPNSPSHVAGHTSPQQGTSSTVPQALQQARRTGKRKRAEDPKDPKAAKRLQTQRQIDALNLKELRGLFVPESVGAVPKKDLTSTSTSQSFCLSGLVNEHCQYSILPKSIRRHITTLNRFQPPYSPETFGPLHPLSKVGVLIERVLNSQEL